MNPRTRKAVFIFVVAGMGVLFFGKPIAPVVIKQAYYRETIDVLNALITGQYSHPLSLYLDE